MLAISLGRRYERLLFFTAPLSLLCLVVLFMAVATNIQKERLDARCLLAAADAVDHDFLGLYALWLDRHIRTKRGTWAKAYKEGLADSAASGDGRYCESLISTMLDVQKDPRENASVIRESAQKLLDSPIDLFGVELPDKATVAVLGTDVKVRLNTADQILKLALAPVLLLWLGSIYNTRYRETLLVGEARTIFEVFPHIINVYPVASIAAPRKRSAFAPVAPAFWRAWYTVIRIALLSVFVVPPVAAYIGSLVLAPFAFSTPLTWLFGGLVGLFALSTLAAETLPWHVRRIFPSPPLTWSE